MIQSDSKTVTVMCFLNHVECG